MQVCMVVMRLIWAAGKKSDLALPMRAQHSDHRVAPPLQRLLQGLPRLGRRVRPLERPKTEGEAASSWCSRER